MKLINKIKTKTKEIKDIMLPVVLMGIYRILPHFVTYRIYQKIRYAIPNYLAKRRYQRAIKEYLKDLKKVSNK